MVLIPDDPAIREIEATGYWPQNQYEDDGDIFASYEGDYNEDTKGSLKSATEMSGRCTGFIRRDHCRSSYRLLCSSQRPATKCTAIYISSR